jgi:hypothetical protein
MCSATSCIRSLLVFAHAGYTSGQVYSYIHMHIDQAVLKQWPGCALLVTGTNTACAHAADAHACHQRHVRTPSEGMHEHSQTHARTHDTTGTRLSFAISQRMAQCARECMRACTLRLTRAARSSCSWALLLPSLHLGCPLLYVEATRTPLTCLLTCLLLYACATSIIPMCCPRIKPFMCVLK